MDCRVIISPRALLDLNTVGIARFWHGARTLDETAFLF